MRADGGNSARFSHIFGAPTRGKIQLDGVTYQLGALSLVWDLSHVTVQGVRGKTVIKTSAIGLLHFHSCSHCIFQDIVFEVSGESREDDYRGVINLMHGQFRNLTFHRCVWRARRAPINGIKIIVEAAISGRHDEGRAESIHFYDCEIDGVGRMGMEVQNHSHADDVERYHDIIWEGGTVRDTGLVNENGQGLSFSGKGSNCRGDTLFENNALACIEGVGVRSSRFTGRAKGQTRRCNPLSFTNLVPMWDNIIEDFRTIGCANGEVQLWSNRALRLRDNDIELSGGIHIRDVTDLESTGERYKTGSQVGLFIEGSSRRNRWNKIILDGSDTPKGAYSMVRFYGEQVQDNVLKTPVLTKPRDGVAVDNLLGAKNNWLIEPQNGDGTPRPKIRRRTLFASDSDFIDPEIYAPQYWEESTIEIASDVPLSRARVFTVPSGVPGCKQLKNITKGGQTIIIAQRDGNSTVMIENGATKSVSFIPGKGARLC